jgi:hypothetical protein
MILPWPILRCTIMFASSWNAWFQPPVQKVEDSISHQMLLDNGILKTSSCQVTMTTQSIGTCESSSCCRLDSHAVMHTSWSWKTCWVKAMKASGKAC